MLSEHHVKGELSQVEVEVENFHPYALDVNHSKEAIVRVDPTVLSLCFYPALLVYMSFVMSLT